MLRPFHKTFQQKLSLEAFEKKFSSFIDTDVRQEESLTKRKGIRAACDEMSALLDLAQYYKASHLKWTGNHTSISHFDGILYFNGIDEQKIEISRLLDEQIEKDMKKIGKFSKILENRKNFIYNRIIKILERKNNQKYKGCWLAIAYEPIIIKINKRYVNQPVFMKIECMKKNLLLSIKKFLKKLFLFQMGCDLK